MLDQWVIYRIRNSIAKKLTELTAEGLLSTTGSRYALPGPVSVHSNARIVLLGIADQCGKVNLGVLGDELLRRIEEECATARADLRIVPHGIIETQVRDWSAYAEIFLSLSRPSDGTEGVMPGYLSALPGRGKSAERIIGFLSRVKEPVSILDQIGVPPGRPFPPTRWPTPWYITFSIRGSRAHDPRRRCSLKSRDASLSAER